MNLTQTDRGDSPIKISHVVSGITFKPIGLACTAVPDKTVAANARALSLMSVVFNMIFPLIVLWVSNAQATRNDSQRRAGKFDQLI